MNFFLYRVSTSPTGRVLAKTLGLRYGHLGDGQPPRRFTRRFERAKEANCLIRWGATDPVVRRLGGTELNTLEAIGRASNKLTTLRLLQEAGVPVPRFTTNADEAAAWNTVVLARKAYGSKGRDIRIFQPGERPHGGNFYTAYVPNEREYRLHVFGGEVIRVQGKYLDFPDQHTNQYVKNYGQGFRFRAPARRLNTDRTSAAVGAVTALGLDFGAVDLLVADRRHCYILEVNTAPSCSPLTGEVYARAFARHLGIPEERLNLAALQLLTSSE